MDRRRIAGVVGGAIVAPALYAVAENVGRILARRGFVVVCGGLSGVMEAASKGAASEGGVVIGILPGADPSSANPHVTHAIVTNMGHARNAVIAHTAEFLVAVGGEAGTLSEIAFALKLGKAVYSLDSWCIEGVRQLSGVEQLDRILTDGE